MDTRSYDLNVREFNERIWRSWKEKPENLRMGTLEEPTKCSEFPEILEIIKPKEYITDGRIFGTPGDPRKIVYLDETLNSGIKVTLRWSKSQFCKRAYRELKTSGISFVVGVEISGEDEMKEFWNTLWDDENNFLLIPGRDINQVPKIDLTLDCLKGKKNIEIIEYHQNILLTDKKIIITKDSINLKPIKIYDRF